MNLANLSNNKLFNITLPIISFMCFIIIWYVLCYLEQIYLLNFSNLPTPQEVVKTWLNQIVNIKYWMDISASLFRVFSGSFLGLLLGIALGLVLTLNNIVFKLFNPIVEIFRPVPLLAYIPLISLIVNNSELSIIFITFLGCFFPVVVNVIRGVNELPEKYIDLVRVNQTSLFRRYVLLIIPFLVPYIYAGFLIGIGSSWMGVITAEILSGSTGIGFYTWQSFNVFNYTDVIVGIFTIGILGSLSSGVISLIKKYMLGRYFKER